MKLSEIKPGYLLRYRDPRRPSNNGDFLVDAIDLERGCVEGELLTEAGELVDQLYAWLDDSFWAPAPQPSFFLTLDNDLVP